MKPEDFEPADDDHMATFDNEEDLQKAWLAPLLEAAKNNPAKYVSLEAKHDWLQKLLEEVKKDPAKYLDPEAKEAWLGLLPNHSENLDHCSSSTSRCRISPDTNLDEMFEDWCDRWTGNDD